MQEVHLYVRTSHRYVDGWSNLDSEEYVGAIKFTPPKMVREGEDFDDGGTYLQFARAPAGMPIDLLKQAVSDSLGGSNCRHEYDCCGCATRSVRVRNNGRNLIVATNVSYNY